MRLDYRYEIVGGGHCDVSAVELASASIAAELLNVGLVEHIRPDRRSRASLRSALNCAHSDDE